MQKKHSIRKLLDGKGYYIVLAVCILAVGVSGLIFYRTLHSATDDEPQALSVPVTAKPADEPTTDKPAAPEKKPASVPTVSIDPDDDVAEAMRIVSPLEGETIAAFSVDTLAYNATMADWRTHNGVDIAAPLGTKVCAVADGVVTAVYDDDYLGTVVTVEHDDGWSTLYANLTAVPTVSAGDSVQAGQVIGAVGQSAMLEVASQPHLHLEVYRRGELTDPVELIG